MRKVHGTSYAVHGTPVPFFVALSGNRDGARRQNFLAQAKRFEWATRAMSTGVAQPSLVVGGNFRLEELSPMSGATRARTPAPHLLAFLERHPVLRVGRADVVGAGADQAVVVELFDYVGGPAADSRYGEDRGEQVYVDSERVVGRG